MRDPLRSLTVRIVLVFVLVLIADIVLVCCAQGPGFLRPNDTVQKEH